MKDSRDAMALLLLATLGAAAQAQSTLTREEVMRELAEARRMGELVIAGCGGGTVRDAFPNRYPAASVAAAAPAPRRPDDGAVADRPPAETPSSR